ncbi:ImcF-related family protein [uncultured Tateyamaria sp.]|uniref:ImcF-related family protein n=1 Tax=uncultured Tateyamaria sp. TaxID=455651 RepID=UPI00261A58D3|nr:ImcF-related family protein [uncultured Tateyamaria sp.]
MTALEEEAAAFRQFVDGLGPKDIRDVPRLVDELAVRLRRFSQRAERSGEPTVTLRPARMALAVFADHRVRALPKTDLTKWGALAQQTIFEGRDVSEADLREFRRIAQDQNYTALEALLSDVLATVRRKSRPKAARLRIVPMLSVLLVTAVIGMAAYLAWLEQRFHAQAYAAYSEFQNALELEQTRESAAVLARLGALSGDLQNVEAAIAQAPLRNMLTLPFADARGTAESSYRQAAARAIGPLLADAIEFALATEGQGLAVYDSLRAYGILTGQTAWEPTFLIGWAKAREEALGLSGFSEHIASLTGPVEGLVPAEAVLLEQARAIATEASEVDRTWLEMIRAPDVLSLPSWKASEALPNLLDVAIRRSGTPLEVPGLYTREGWDRAQTISAGVAVTKSRQVTEALFGRPLPQQNGTVDLVMERLQTETIDAWTKWLADLRVRPFDDPDRAIIVSGTLSQATSPLSALFEEIWTEIGGRDRSRPRPFQTEIARSFGPAIQYVEQGRMEEIAALFAAVNVALVTRSQDAARGDHAILAVAERARSIQSLRAAPRLVVQLVEDTLAQISAPVVADDTPISRQWARIQAACQAELEGRYPFGEGAAVPVATTTNFFGQQGLLPQFFAQYARPNLETEDGPWRWKTEARFAGLSPESATFLEQSMAISSGLFGGTGLGAEMMLATLAERGQASFRLGGQTTSLRASGAASRLAWPGPVSEQGVAVQFNGGVESSLLSHPGAWGMHRMLDGVRVRPRDEGRRFLVDLRDETGRIFLEVQFDEPVNPVSIRPLMADFACPSQL